MIWSIIFNIYKNNEIVEEGFDTAMAQDLSHALQEVDTILDLKDCDKIELTIVKTTLKHEG